MPAAPATPEIRLPTVRLERKMPREGTARSEVRKARAKRPITRYREMHILQKTQDPEKALLRLSGETRAAIKEASTNTKKPDAETATQAPENVTPATGAENQTDGKNTETSAVYNGGATHPEGPVAQPDNPQEAGKLNEALAVLQKVALENFKNLKAEDPGGVTKAVELALKAKIPEDQVKRALEVNGIPVNEDLFAHKEDGDSKDSASKDVKSSAEPKPKGNSNSEGTAQEKATEESRKKILTESLKARFGKDKKGNNKYDLLPEEMRKIFEDAIADIADNFNDRQWDTYAGLLSSRGTRHITRRRAAEMARLLVAIPETITSKANGREDAEKVKALIRGNKAEVLLADKKGLSKLAKEFPGGKTLGGILGLILALLGGITYEAIKANSLQELIG